MPKFLPSCYQQGRGHGHTLCSRNPLFPTNHVAREKSPVDPLRIAFRPSGFGHVGRVTRRVFLVETCRRRIIKHGYIRNIYMCGTCMSLHTCMHAYICTYAHMCCTCISETKKQTSACIRTCTSGYCFTLFLTSTSWVTLGH